MPLLPIILFFFFFNDTATTEIYTLSLHDALPISAYKIAHSAVYAERGEILRQRGVVAQAPFIEATPAFPTARSEEHTSELQSRSDLVCRLLLEKKKKNTYTSSFANDSVTASVNVL